GALARAPIRMRPLYQPRHTSATLSLSSGEKVGWVADMLGHTTTEMVIRHSHKFIPTLTRQDGSALASQIELAGLGPPLSAGLAAARFSQDSCSLAAPTELCSHNLQPQDFPSGGGDAVP